MVGVGEGAYGPSANALLCAAAPPEKRGRALGIYNIGMAFGATSGLVLGNALAPHDRLAQRVLDRGRPLDPARRQRGVRGGAGPPRSPDQAPRPAYLLAPTYLIALAGGILSTFGASALVVWAQALIVGERHLAPIVANMFMARRRARARHRRRRRRRLPG